MTNLRWLESKEFGDMCLSDFEEGMKKRATYFDDDDDSLEDMGDKEETLDQFKERDPVGFEREIGMLTAAHLNKVFWY